MKTKSSGVGSLVTCRSYRIGTSSGLQIDWATMSGADLSRKKWGGDVGWLLLVEEQTSSWQLLMQKADLSSLLVVHYSMSLKSLQDSGGCYVMFAFVLRSLWLLLANTTTNVTS